MERPRKPIQFVAMTLPWEQLPDYPDIGSWKVNADNSPAFIGAADTGSDISNMGILLHEIIESFLCWTHGVKEADVSKFDQEWFTGKHEDNEEPGNDPKSPYREQHKIAETFEQGFIAACGMTWDKHSENCRKVYAD